MSADATTQRRTTRDLEHCRTIFRNYFPDQQVTVTSVRPTRGQYIIIGTVDGERKRVALPVNHPALRQYDTDASVSGSESDSDSVIEIGVRSAVDCNTTGPLGHFCTDCEDSGNIFA